MNTHLKKFFFLLFSLCILAAFGLSATAKLVVPSASLPVADDRDFPDIFLNSDTDLLL